MSSNRKSVEDLVGHALTDRSFRRRLRANPEETLREEGYEVTPEIVEAIRSANHDEIEAFESNSADRKAGA